MGKIIPLKSRDKALIIQDRGDKVFFSSNGTASLNIDEIKTLINWLNTWVENFNS